MATSPVDVCNIALKRLGADSIVAFDEGSSAASLCEQLYSTTVDRILREHQWNFAQFRVTLARRVDVPSFGYDYNFTLPTRPYCLRVNETYPAYVEYDIENSVAANGDIQGRVLVTNEGDMKIRYTGRIEDVTLWDASFTDAVAFDLATQMAYPLTESAGLAKVIGGEALQKLQHARSIDSQEGSTKQADIGILVDVRSHGFREAYNRSKNKFS